jgi:hypothetical protein
VSKARWRRWAQPLLIAPLLFFALSASSHLEIRCALTGVVVPACCPEGADPAPAEIPQHPSISERDCCDRSLVTADKLPAGAPERGLERAPVAVGSLARLTVERRIPSSGALNARTVGQWASAPPPFLLTHAFLI